MQFQSDAELIDGLMRLEIDTMIEFLDLLLDDNGEHYED